MINWIIIMGYFIFLYFLVFWLIMFIEEQKKESEKIAGLVNFPMVSVIIPAYNEEKNIKDTMNCALNLDYPKNKIEIIVVNDGSKDKTAKVVEDIIKKNKDKKIILINQENKGKGAAMNAGLAIAKGEYFASLDADSTVKKDSLKIMLPLFNKRVGAVLSLIKIKQKDSFMRKVQSCEYLVNFFYKMQMSRIDSVHVTPGPFSVYKTDIVRSLGGYDVGNLTEDLELALRLQKHDYRIVQSDKAIVYTKAPSNFISYNKQRNRWYKGAILNILDYKEMLFNRKYGDFGVFVLPTTLISSFLSVLLFFTVLYLTIMKPVYRTLYSLSFIKFDFFPILKESFKNFSLLNLDFVIIFYTIMILIVVLFFVILAYKRFGESPKKNYKPLLYYLLFYPAIAFIILSGVFIDLARGKKQKW